MPNTSLRLRTAREERTAQEDPWPNAPRWERARTDIRGQQRLGLTSTIPIREELVKQLEPAPPKNG